MTPGQELALEQLRAIEEADPLAFEVIHTRPIEGRQDILVTVSISCRGIQCRPEGLPLRERERFVIWVPPAFPFVKPDIWVPHKRFAGRAHVQWEQHLCLYQAPQTEWDYSDGMFGYIRRLWVWLEHGARNEPDPEGQPIHPPVAYTGESQLVIVPRADTPLLEGQPWFGFAHLDAINARAFAITSWHAVSVDEVPPPPVAPVILLLQNLPWEMPQQMGNLCSELEKSGVTKQKGSVAAFVGELDSLEAEVIGFESKFERPGRAYGRGLGSSVARSRPAAMRTGVRAPSPLLARPRPSTARARQGPPKE